MHWLLSCPICHRMPPDVTLRPWRGLSQTLTLSSSILVFFFSGASDPWPGPELWVLFFFSSFEALAFSLPFIVPFRPDRNRNGGL